MQFIVAWCNVICVSCLTVLLTPFIELWTGASYVLPNFAVALMVFNYFMRGIQWPVEAFYNADGLYKHFGKKPWIEAALNVLFSILLCRCFGVVGIILGTTLAQMCATLWYDIYITNKYTLHGSLKKYWYLTLQYSFVTGLLTLVCMWACMNISTPWPWLTWCGKAIVCILISGVLFGAIYRKDIHFHYFVGLLRI
jgi:O-antigen/teichoic acid export membrane protein